MQIMIDIPEETFNTIKNKMYCGIYDADLYKAIANGTPLPENHGRLIDADVFEKSLMNARSYYLGEKADDFDLRFAAGLKSAAERLVDAPTIIEADKAESEDQTE